MTPGQRLSNAIGQALVYLAGVFTYLAFTTDNGGVLYAFGAVVLLPYGVLLLFLSHSGTTRNGR